MSIREAYQQKLEARLAEWQADMEKLKAKTEQADAESQLAYHREMERLRTRQDAARDKLDKLKEASDDAWHDMKAGVEMAWFDLGDAMHRAAARFN